MIELPQAMVDQVVAHARRDHPDECCGVIAGVGGRATRVFEMTNAERSPTGFVFDSAQWLQVHRSIDDADEDLLVVYHSHTMTEAYPSRTDIGYASGPAADPRTHYVLVSTRHHGPQTGLADDEVEFRSFRIVDGEVSEEEVEIVESYLFGHSPTTVVYD